LLTRKIFLLVFCVVAMTAAAKFPRAANHYSFYYGYSYRFSPQLTRVVELTHEKFFSTCLHASFSGWGLRLDYFQNNQYALSAKYFKSLASRPHLLVSPYVAISPQVFFMGDVKGLNLKPEVGIRFNSAAFTRRQPLSLSINCAYGYEIPVLAEKAYLPRRHDISVKMALSINIKEVAYYFGKGKPELKDTLSHL